MPPSLSRAISLPRSRSRDWAAALYLPEAFAALVLVRLGLSALGLARVRQLGLPPTLQRPVPGRDAHRLVRAVRAASRVVPFASCLTQAQAAQIVLARRGLVSILCLGVRETPAGEIAAHAWLISEGGLVLGGHTRELTAFRQLAKLVLV